MAKVDTILKDNILEAIISNYTEKELESEHCGDTIPILFMNRLQNMRASRRGTKLNNLSWRLYEWRIRNEA